ncbi:MAG: glutaredoxin domain-containing protein [Candidatus Omnitrophota bacterium]
MSNVKVYSTPACPYCRKAKEFLHENNIEFEDINIAADQRTAREIIEKTGRMSVPVIDIDGKYIIGYDEPALKETLHIK